MKKGASTGPQKANLREEAAKAAPPEEEVTGESELETVTELARVGRAWDAACSRVNEEAGRLAQAAEALKASTELGRDIDDVTDALRELQGIEKKVQDVRLLLEQLESML